MTLDPDLIDRLGAAALECRELLSEVHSATKALRQVIRDAETAKASLKTAIDEMLDESLTPHVIKAVDEIGVATQQTIESAEQRVYARFDKIADILTGEERSDDRTPLEEIARKLNLVRGAKGSGS